MAQNAIRQWESCAPAAEVAAARAPGQLKALAKALAEELRAGGKLPLGLSRSRRALHPRVDATLARVQRGPEQSPTRRADLVEGPVIFREREYRIYSNIRRNARKSPENVGVRRDFRSRKSNAVQVTLQRAAGRRRRPVRFQSSRAPAPFVSRRLWTAQLTCSLGRASSHSCHFRTF